MITPNGEAGDAADDDMTDAEYEQLMMAMFEHGVLVTDWFATMARWKRAAADGDTAVMREALAEAQRLDPRIEALQEQISAWGREGLRDLVAETKDDDLPALLATMDEAEDEANEWRRRLGLEERGWGHEE